LRQGGREREPRAQGRETHRHALSGHRITPPGPAGPPVEFIYTPVRTKFPCEFKGLWHNLPLAARPRAPLNASGILTLPGAPRADLGPARGPRLLEGERVGGPHNEQCVTVARAVADKMSNRKPQAGALARVLLNLTVTATTAGTEARPRDLRTRKRRSGMQSG